MAAPTKRDELQAILDAMPLLFFHKDTENRICRVNKAAADSLGVRPEDMAGTDTAEWFPEEADEYYRDDLEVIRSGRPRLGIVEQLQVGDSEKHWICTDKFPHHDADGNVDGILVFIRDATAEAETEAALRRSEERLGSVLATAPDLMLVLDGEGTLLEIFGSTTEDNLVAPAERLLGKTVHDVLPQDVADAGQAVIDRTLSTRSLQEYEYSLDIRGTRQMFSARVVPLDTEDRPCVLWSARNTTEQRNAEENRRLLENQVRHAQKLESLGVLAGGVAHDFNNLLAVVLGNAELASAEIAGDSPGAAYLDSIQEAARRAADLCQQMLAYSGRGRFVVERLDLSRVVRDMIDLLGAAVSKMATVRLDLSPDIPPIDADATQVRQILMNLITNASESLGDGSGEISLSTGTMECDAEFLSLSLCGDELGAGTYVFFECADTGRGMDDETVARMFEPFFTTKFAGRGLGLSAVVGIVKGHGGALRTWSRPGGGTAVRVILPPADVRAVAEVEIVPAPPTGPVVGGTVLLVDDEPAVLQTGRRILQAGGVSVRTASNGREAVELMRVADDIACVVLDLTMPVLGGLDAYREMRKIRGGVPVILTSGYGDQDLASQFGQEGFAGFLRKPYDSKRMLDMVRASLRPTARGGAATERT